MVSLGYHASHEQFAPSELLQLLHLAEASKFRHAMSSDHFKPWGPSQGHSGFAWSWLGAAMQATGMQLGVISAPGYRYHPAIIAQGAATLSEMFPERFWLALGSGERLNEDIVGGGWPSKEARTRKLAASAQAIKSLLGGDTVSVTGEITVNDAKLYSLPARRPKIFGAAVTAKTAEAIGQWADGLLTVNTPVENLKKVIDAFRRGGGDGKPLYLQVTLNWDVTNEAALEGAHEQWRFNALGGDINWELRSPEQFDEATRHLRPSDMHDTVRISSSVAQHIDWLSEYAELGFERLYLHQVGRNQQEFIACFGEKVLPHFRV
jgi:coenzyme F420-dependent glucose-6-phosphate dehydrogenase